MVNKASEQLFDTHTLLHPQGILKKINMHDKIYTTPLNNILAA